MSNDPTTARLKRMLAELERDFPLPQPEPPTNPLTIGDLKRIIEFMPDDWVVHSVVGDDENGTYQPFVEAAHNGAGLFLADREDIGGALTDTVCGEERGEMVFPSIGGHTNG